MIGEQSRAKLRESAADRHSLADTFTSPASLRETRPIQVERDVNDLPAWLVFRTALAFVSVFCLVMFGMRFRSFDGWVASDGLMMSLFLVTVGVVSSYFYRWAMPNASGFWPGLGRRLITIVPTVLLIIIVAILFARIEVEEFALASLGCCAAQLTVDWRCFVSARRNQFVHWLPTVICGAIAGIVSSVVGENFEFGVFAIVVTVSLAVTLQLVSPFDPIKTPSKATSPNSLKNQISDNSDDDSFVLSSLVHTTEAQGVVS
jgi:hypothetical protein